MASEEEKIQNLNVKAGKLFCVSSGEYSDYGYGGHYLALVEITYPMFMEVVNELKAIEAAAREKTGYSPYDSVAQYNFMAAIVKRGWVMDIDVQEIHIGSYSELDLA